MRGFIKQSFLILAVLAPALGFAQGTLTITFDGPPVQTGQSVVSSYVESGMHFGSQLNGFERFDPGFLPGFPDNGTAYIGGAGHNGYNNLYAYFTDGSTFGVKSIDLAAFGGSSTDISAEFSGWRSDGTYLTLSVSGTGIDFRTLNFGPEWASGLTAFGVPNDQSSPDGWSVDNLVVVVPEPASGALLVGGVITFSFWGSRRKR